MDGLLPASQPRIFWNSRKRSAASRSLEKAPKEEGLKAPPPSQSEDSAKTEVELPSTTDDNKESKPALSERRRSLFEPLPSANSHRAPAEVLLPPPDFDTMSYPKGWLVGKKRKLVNVDVVESMRRIAIQEMNRKDREINGLNEQLEEDARCFERLQVQLLEERSKRADVERQNTMLQEQISMLMDMMEQSPAAEDEASEDH